MEGDPGRCRCITLLALGRTTSDLSDCSHSVIQSFNQKSLGAGLLFIAASQESTKEMPVYVKGRLDFRMAHYNLDRFRVCARVDQERGEGVAALVKGEQSRRDPAKL